MRSEKDSPADVENAFFVPLNNEEFNVQNIYTVNTTDNDDNNFIAITGSENNYHSIIVHLPSNIAAGTCFYSPQTIVNVPNLNITYSNLAD